MTFFRRISEHSLVALENQSLLLIGGMDLGNDGGYQSGIWQLKDENWNQIGELLQVWKNNSIKMIFLYFRPAILDLPFISADQFIILDAALRPFKDLISTKQKNFKTSNKLETNHTVYMCLYCSKLFPITVFEIFCNLFFSSSFWIKLWKISEFLSFRQKKLYQFYPEKILFISDSKSKNEAEKAFFS